MSIRRLRCHCSRSSLLVYLVVACFTTGCFNKEHYCKRYENEKVAKTKEVPRFVNKTHTPVISGSEIPIGISPFKNKTNRSGLGGKVSEAVAKWFKGNSRARKKFRLVQGDPARLLTEQRVRYVIGGRVLKASGSKVTKLRVSYLRSDALDRGATSREFTCNGALDACVDESLRMFVGWDERVRSGTKKQTYYDTKRVCAEHGTKKKIDWMTTGLILLGLTAGVVGIYFAATNDKKDDE